MNHALQSVEDKKANAFISRLINKENDLLTACELIISQINEHRFHEHAKNLFSRPGFSPVDIHKAIYRLDSRILITPNVDRIYEQYAFAESQGTVTLKSYYDEDVASFLRTKDIIILKVHGSIDSPSRMIFSRKQYTDARYKHMNFYKILDALALTHTFLFLGCGLSDPDIRLTLENYTFWYPGCRPHYFVAAKGSINPDIEKSLNNNCNISMLYYSNKDKLHSNLTKSLNVLAEKAKDGRRLIAEYEAW